MNRRLLVAVALAAGVACAACSTSEAGTPAAPPMPAPAAAATTTPAPGTPVTNSRGNLPKQLGETAKVAGPSGEVELEFRVDAIRTNARCAADFGTFKPDNGQFIAVDITARTTAAFRPDGLDANLLAGGYNWRVVDANGMRHNTDSASAWMCSPESRQNLLDLTPGVSVQGTVYVDAPTNASGGALVLSSPGVEGGWEWPIP